MPRRVGNTTLYTLYEIATLLAEGRGNQVDTELRTLRAAVSDGRLQAHKLGNTYWVTQRNLDRFLEGETISAKLEVGELSA